MQEPELICKDCGFDKALCRCSHISNRGWLKEIMENAKKDVCTWPDWMLGDELRKSKSDG